MSFNFNYTNLNYSSDGNNNCYPQQRQNCNQQQWPSFHNNGWNNCFPQQNLYCHSNGMPTIRPGTGYMPNFNVCCESPDVTNSMMTRWEGVFGINNPTMFSCSPSYQNYKAQWNNYLDNRFNCIMGGNG